MTYLPEYAELHCLSCFSFQRGASHPEELVARAHALGYRALALTDECSLAGIVRAHAEAKRCGIKLLVGSEFLLRDDVAEGVGDPPVAPASSPGMRVLLLARNRNGYGNLCELISLGRRRAAKGHYQLAPDDLLDPPDSLMHLRGMPDCLLILLPGDAATLARLLEALAPHFNQRVWLGVHRQLRGAADEQLREMVELARAHRVPVVACGGVRMHLRSRKPLLDAMTAIRVGRPVAECGFALDSNAEAHLRARVRLAALYPPQWLAETVAIADVCEFSLDELRYEYPEELVPAGHTPASYLREQTWLGAHARFAGGIPLPVQQQIERELEIIGELRYEPYFLTVHDIVRFARGRGILCQGRGSAANSAVCYCLHITEVDPARIETLFERFLSKARDEPPDIDVDFEHQRREEVIQYIYDKYGRHRAALAAAIISYRPRSAVRDAGRVLGIDNALIDEVSRSQQWWDGKERLAQRLQERFVERGLDPQALQLRQWAMLAEQLIGFPRHLSQHVGGFVIARDRLTRLVPVENAAMDARSVIQWDKDDLESLGLLKVDILALGMLSALRRALELVGDWRGEPLTLQDIPAEDARTYDMICAADTVGVFQIESRAQQSMLPRLKPRCFYDLVIEVAIVRPGPIQGGMVHPYLRRREGAEPVTYPGEGVRRALQRTLGVPIFQEQVMQVAMHAAGFSAVEADALRRAMAAWRRKGGVHHFHEKVVSGMLSNGYDRAFAEAIFRQIEGFGEYGFPESHAASFALLVYSSAWLKRHHPAAFLAALLNSQPMGFYTPAQLVQDARRHGVEVRAVDVRHSDWECRLEPPADAAGDRSAAAGAPAVRLGLNCIRGMREESAWRIELARAVRPFADVADLARRCRLDRHDLQALAAADALRGLAGNRREALWRVAAIRPDSGLVCEAADDMAPAFAPLAEGEDIVQDYRHLGLTLRRHPLALLRERLVALRFMSAQTLAGARHGQLARACGIVTVRQRPSTAGGTLFVTLEDETGNVNVIVWPQLLERQRRELLAARLLGVYGVWQRVGEVRHLLAQRVVDLTPLLGELAIPSRDFH